MLIVNEKVLASLCVLLATFVTISSGAESPATSGSDSKLVEPEKRFYSWEGKRYDDSKQVDKRKFYQWAGKRSENDGTKVRSGGGGELMTDQDQDQELNKRKFYQWAGKRKFYAWAGKRDLDREESDESRDHSLSAGAPEKRKFYQWAGKRSETVNDDNNEVNNENAPEKRKFYAWAGKRSEANDNNDQVPEKRKFYAWAGRK